jgi:cyclin H
VVGSKAYLARKAEEEKKAELKRNKKAQDLKKAELDDDPFGTELAKENSGDVDDEDDD